jgi:error-prone DNA polymerase
VRVGGLVVARQRPGTANGIVFMLLEDEVGTINLVVPPEMYERHRLTVRTEPLVLAGGRLERHPAGGGAINVLVDALEAIAAPDLELAEIRDFSPTTASGGGADERERARIAAAEAGEVELAAAGGTSAGGGRSDFRAVAPPAMSFASGRRR